MKQIEINKFVKLDNKSLSKIVVNLIETIFRNEDIIKSLSKLKERTYLAIFRTEDNPIPTNVELMDEIENAIKDKWYFIDRATYNMYTHVIYCLINVEKIENKLYAKMLEIWYDQIGDTLYIFVENEDLDQMKWVKDIIFLKKENK